MKKITTILVTLPIALVLLTGCGSTQPASTETKEPVKQEATTQEPAKAEPAEQEPAKEEPAINLKDLTYKSGTYTAAAEGKGGPVKVEVIFSEKKIDSVKVIEHKETPEISDDAIKNIPSQIVEKQSLAVDSVSGATITSKAIKDAVTDAVKQASGQK